jgi:hypothetical protein
LYDWLKVRSNFPKLLNPTAENEIDHLFIIMETHVNLDKFCDGTNRQFAALLIRISFCFSPQKRTPVLIMVFYLFLGGRERERERENSLPKEVALKENSNDHTIVCNHCQRDKLQRKFHDNAKAKLP